MAGAGGCIQRGSCALCGSAGARAWAGHARGAIRTLCKEREDGHRRDEACHSHGAGQCTAVQPFSMGKQLNAVGEGGAVSVALQLLAPQDQIELEQVPAGRRVLAAVEWQQAQSAQQHATLTVMPALLKLHSWAPCCAALRPGPVAQCLSSHCLCFSRGAGTSEELLGLAWWPPRDRWCGLCCIAWASAPTLPSSMPTPTSRMSLAGCVAWRAAQWPPQPPRQRRPPRRASRAPRRAPTQHGLRVSSSGEAAVARDRQRSACAAAPPIAITACHAIMTRCRQPFPASHMYPAGRSHVAMMRKVRRCGCGGASGHKGRHFSLYFIGNCRVLTSRWPGGFLWLMALASAQLLSFPAATCQLLF